MQMHSSVDNRFFGKPDNRKQSYSLFWKRGVVVSLSVFSSMGCLADPVVDSLPSAPSTHACLVPPSFSGATSPASSVTSFQRKKRDRSCFVSAESLISSHAQGKATFVDVRAPQAFERYNIPGSLNIPLHAVKAKTFLKPTAAILVDEGHATANLETACAELRKAGFAKVSILDGGLYAWRTKRGPLSGDAIAHRELERMDASELFVERLYDDWLVLDFSSTKRPALRRWLPRDIESIDVKGDAVASIKTSVAKRRGVTPALRILVISDTGKDYDAIARIVAKSGVTNASYLEQGLSDYADHVTKQTVMWDQRDKPQALPACKG